MKKSATCLALLLWTVAWPTSGIEPAGGAPAAKSADGLHRCIGADGVTIFTDRRCGDVQAVESAQPMAPIRPGVLVRVRSCARSQDDLLFGVRSALENRDVNRLAEFYHWTGLGNDQGYRLMARLSAFSERPMVDVRLVSSAEQGAGQDDYPLPDSDPAAEDGGDAFAMEPAGPPIVAARPARAADLLRVDQMRSSEDLAAQVTYFRLRSNAGCWWIQF